MQQSNKAGYNLWQNKTEANFLLSGGKKEKKKMRDILGICDYEVCIHFSCQKLLAFFFWKQKIWVRIN